MRHFISILIAGYLLLGPCCIVASADGGRLVLMEQQGDYRISVFTSPDPPRAGLVDISVLLQDAETARPIADAIIDVCLTPRDKATPTIHASATSSAATNKLLRAALVELPEAGWWDVGVKCSANNETPVEVKFAMEAVQRLPRWLTAWTWFSWPLGVVVLFGIHRFLVARKQARTVHSSNLTRPPSSG